MSAWISDLPDVAGECCDRIWRNRFPRLNAATANRSVVSIGVNDVLTVMGLDASNSRIMENVRLSRKHNSSIQHPRWPWAQ